MTMSLAQALTEKLVVTSIYHDNGSNYWIYICNTCKQYLVYEQGQYRFLCKCHEV